jgi:hypothetical protein
MNKGISVIFISNKIKKEFELLNKGKFEEKKLYSFINNAIDDLKLNPEAGIKIPKRLWPKEYIVKYEINNLWKYNLPNAWRLVYTIEMNRIMIFNIILDWLDHKNYERKFNY